MIGQYLSNTNEKATVSILQNILELNKALVCSKITKSMRTILVQCTPRQIQSLTPHVLGTISFLKDTLTNLELLHLMSSKLSRAHDRMPQDPMPLKKRMNRN